MENFKIKHLVFAILGVVLLFIIISLFPFVTIGAGERGVVMNFGRVQDEILSEGIHWRTPIVQSVKTMSVRVQKTEKIAEAASKDGQDVKVTAVVNWRFRSDKVNLIYQSVGDVPEMDGNILLPAIDEVVKAATAKMQALEILNNRTALKENIDKVLKERMVKYSVVVDDISLTQVKFSPEFDKAIEDKQIAEQQAKQAQYVADKAIKDAEAAVNRAKGEAEAQRLQQQTLTEELLKKMWIEKWNGILPGVVTDGSILLQLPKK